MIFSYKFTNVANINIDSTKTYIDNNIFYLDSYSEFKLTKEAYKALRQGISLEMHTDFQLLEKRKWLWNKIVFKKTLVHKLEHKPLTENFLVTNVNNGIVGKVGDTTILYVSAEIADIGV